MGTPNIQEGTPQGAGNVPALIQEKCGQALAHRSGNNQLGRWDANSNGSQPGAKRAPHKRGKDHRQVMRQTLTDDTGLNEYVIRMRLAFDGVAVFL